MNNTINNGIMLEVLVSTMNRRSLAFLTKMFPYHDINHLNILIINQTKKGTNLVSKKKNIRVINSFERGLSKSRNLAIQNSIGDICLIADDDVEYFSDFQDTVIQAFNEIKNTSIIRFKIDTFEGEEYKPYPQISKQIFKKKDLLDSSSIEIAFKRHPIVNNNIKFNILFGLGSYFKSGEEYLFLKEARDQNLLIYFKNKSIVKHALKRSTSNIGHDNFVKAQAALYFEDYKFLSYVFLLKFIFFLFRNGIIPLNQISSKFFTGIHGINDYRKLKIKYENDF